MKKLYIFLLASVSVFAMADTKAALNGVCGRKVNVNVDSTNLQWVVDLSQHTLTITGSGRMRDYDTDTKAPWYDWRGDIYTLTLPDGLITIGDYAMYGLNQLKTINWGDSLREIHQHGFDQCSALEQIVIPDGVVSIDIYAFSGDRALQTITIGNSVTTIADRAFESCNNFTEIDFQNSPANIGYRAFYGANKLVTIKAKRIKNIGREAFGGCGQLVNLQLGDSLLSIDYEAFEGCSALRTIHLPASLNSFSALSFRNCQALDTLTVDSANTTYDSRNNCNAAIHTASNTVVLGCAQTILPEGVVAIGQYTFYVCNRLQSITLPTGLQRIESNAFQYCTALQSVVLPDGLLQIGSNAFNNCPNLQSIVLPDGLQSIGSYAFNGCRSLKTVSLPNSVTSIECGVFHDCDSITSPVYNSTYFVYLPVSYQGDFTIPGTPEKIACQAFDNCDGLTSVVVPSSVTNINDLAFINCDHLQTVPLPDGLVYIGSRAFEGCVSLDSITIPARIKTINERTFYNCPVLSSIDIPDSVTSIGNYAFSYCSAMTSISFPSNLKGFGRDMLQGCTNLDTIHWNVKSYNSFSTVSYYDPFYSIRGQVTAFNFGDSVQVIPDNLCYNMKQLTSLSLGCSITKIGNGAFEGCSNIKSIHWNLRTNSDPKIYTEAPFYGLRDSITEFTFGDSVRYIPNYLCHSMKHLRQLYIPENVSAIGAFAFRYVEDLDSISVHAGNKHYDSRQNCNALIESATDELLLGCYKTYFPADIKGIGDCAFHHVRNLQSVILPKNVTFVGKEAFNNCKDLAELSLPNAIETIDDYAFQDCDSLSSVTLPENLAFVGLRAFAHCSGLELINCKAPTPPIIDITSFSGTTCPFYVPCANIAAYRSAPIWADFKTRIAGEAIYTLTIRPNEFAYGVVTMLQQPNCEHNAIIEAEPSRGYEFVAWQDESGRELSTDMHYEFALEEDLNLIAIFQRSGQGLENACSDGKAIWFDIMGHRIDEPTHGVYIVQTGSDTRKVVIP